MPAKLMRMQLHKSSGQLLSLGLTVMMTIAFGAGCCIFSGKASPTAAVDDRALETRVTSALSQDSLLKDSRIVVKSTEGVVELTGFVGSTGTKSRAGRRRVSELSGTMTISSIASPTSR